MATTDSPKHIITSLVQGLCVRSYKGGQTIKQIACIMGLSVPTVHGHLVKAGVEMRPRGPVRRKEAGSDRPRGRPIVLTRAVLAETVALRASGLTLAEVGAQQGGITRQAVAWRLKMAARQNVSETGGA